MMHSSSFCGPALYLLFCLALAATSVVASCASHPGTEASAQFQQSSVCALNRQKDWFAQSENQTLMTTNLLLACPSVVEILENHQQRSLTWQLHEYIDFQLRNRADQHLEWIFFLKDHEMLFSHSPRSLKKFLPSVPNELIALSFEHGGTQSALGLFAIRLSPPSVRLLDSVNELLEQGRGLSEIEAVTIVLTSLSKPTSVAMSRSGGLRSEATVWNKLHGRHNLVWLMLWRQIGFVASLITVNRP
jgi:hypothetical protein